jgi:hypothetical protein
VSSFEHTSSRREVLADLEGIEPSDERCMTRLATAFFGSSERADAAAALRGLCAATAATAADSAAWVPDDAPPIVVDPFALLAP